MYEFQYVWKFAVENYSNIISPQQIWPYNIYMQLKIYTLKNVYIHICIA